MAETKITSSHERRKELFPGLIRNLPRTIEEFIREATAIVRALQQRSRKYDRIAATTPSSISAFLTAENDLRLRDLIRMVFRKELRKCGTISAEPAEVSVANRVR